MHLTPLSLAAAYCLDLVAGDPQWMPHPIRWIGRLIGWLEKILYNANCSAPLQRLAGVVFWFGVVAVVTLSAVCAVQVAGAIHAGLGSLLVIWLAFSTLATRSLHQESRQVVAALEAGDIGLARQRLAMIVSRDTERLDEQDILRAVMETVSENISDGILAPLFYLTVGGVVGGLIYKAVNTMDSMVGYLNDRYRHFGWFAAKADDVANWVPARLTGLLVIAGAFLLQLDWRSGWRVMRRDAGKMKSPNAGFPEAAACGSLGVQLGGTNWYFGQPVAKPTLGDRSRPLTIAAYRSMIRLLYATSLLAFLSAMTGRQWVCAVWLG